MKTILTLCAAMLLFIQTPIAAHVIAAPPEEPTITPDVMPSFRGGGMHHFRAWLNSEMVYPKKAMGKGIDGEVEVSFIIEKNGKLTGIETLRSTDELFSKEVVRALKDSPRWEPGTMNGVPVRTRLTTPVTLFMPGEPQLLSTEGKKVDVMPKFQDGDHITFAGWVLNKLTLPVFSPEPVSASTARASVTSGLPTGSKIADRTAVISWVVDETGRVTDIIVIKTSDRAFSDEVVRVLQKSPQWTPGSIDGKPVGVVFISPIAIKLSPEPTIRPL